MARSLKNMMGAGLGAESASLINGVVIDGLVATGSTQTDALLLSNDVNVVGTVDAGTGVRLRATPQPGDECVIANLGANLLSVYPALGGSIQGGAINAAYQLLVGAAAAFVARSGSLNWAVLSSGGTAPVAPTLGALTFSATTFTVGTPSSGTINGATVGSTITATGLPTGVTISSVARTWAYDGTGTGSTGSLTLTETLAGATNTPRSSTIGYTVNSSSLSAGTIAFDTANGWTTGENPPAIAITMPSDGSVQIGDWFRNIYGTSSSLAGATNAPWHQITSGDVLGDTLSITYDWGAATLPNGLTYFATQFGRGVDATHITLTSPLSNIINDTLTTTVTNLILNGTFADTSVWTIGGANGGTTISGGVLNCSGNSGMCYQPITYSNGGTYQVDFDYTCTSGANIMVDLSTDGSHNAVQSGALTTDGASHHITLSFISNVTNAQFRLQAANALFTGTIDNVALIRTA